MLTAIYNEYQIVEVLKVSKKTCVVRDLTSYSDKEFRVKKEHLKEDKFIELNEDTAKTASMIVRKKGLKYGMQKFNYNSQDLGNGEYMHTFGQGYDSGIISSMSEWRVIR